MQPSYHSTNMQYATELSYY